MTLQKALSFVAKALAPERDFYILAAIYGVGISLLSLATPISVQMLINTVANTGLATPLVVLSGALFVLLAMSGLLNALRLHLMEIFGRRFYARFVSEIAVRSIYAQNPFFADQRRSDLFNRYFDIITVQKNMPILMIGGFTLILQAGVGFILVSLYHPLFFVFNSVVALMIWGVWAIWGRASVLSAIELSHRKHASAGWLEGIGSSNGFYKSQRHIASALTGTDEVTRAYVDQHKRHFRNFFSQTLSFLFIYAAASATLLGLGGWLVIEGQLSIGQLVAAELVLSAAFFGVSQLGAYLTYFYDMCASIEELMHFYDVPQEEPAGRNDLECADSGLAFVGARGDARGREATLNFAVRPGAKVMAAASNHGVQRLVTNMLKRHFEPRGGFVAFGGLDVLDADAHALRQEIIVLDRPSTIDMTIREYLRLSAEDQNPASTLEALRVVGLESVIASLEEGLDTRVAATGWPLSTTELMQLKLAAAMLARPRVLILSQLFDLMAEECLRRALVHMMRDERLTVVYFTNRRADIGADAYLYLDYDRQEYLPTFEAFRARARQDAPRMDGVSGGAPSLAARAPVALIGKE
ncbi:MAG: ABC transporter ATP-binding protein [Parvularculaceae bacterium]